LCTFTKYGCGGYWDAKVNQAVGVDPHTLSFAAGNLGIAVVPLFIPGIGEEDAAELGAAKLFSRIGNASKAAEAAPDAASLLGKQGDVVVLGRLPDTAVAKSWAGHVVLDTPSWSPQLNEQFISETIRQGRTVYLASPVEGNLIQTEGRFAGQPTIYAEELQQLSNAGYARDGDYLVPPK
jgi:hypothetical protein